jgi:hypothetical protein
MRERIRAAFCVLAVIAVVSSASAKPPSAPASERLVDGSGAIVGLIQVKAVSAGKVLCLIQVTKGEPSLTFEAICKVVTAESYPTSVDWASGKLVTNKAGRGSVSLTTRVPKTDEKAFFIYATVLSRPEPIHSYGAIVRVPVP